MTEAVVVQVQILYGLEYITLLHFTNGIIIKGCFYKKQPHFLFTLTLTP